MAAYIRYIWLKELHLEELDSHRDELSVNVLSRRSSACLQSRTDNGNCNTIDLGHFQLVNVNTLFVAKLSRSTLFMCLLTLKLDFCVSSGPIVSRYQRHARVAQKLEE